MTKRTVSRVMCRGWAGAALLLGAVLGAGEARADYNIKATEAANTSLVTDGRCNLAEAIDSLNNGRTAPGSGLYGCVNVGGGTVIFLEGTGAHYRLGSGVAIRVNGVEIRSKVNGRDFIESSAGGQVLTVNAGASLTFIGVTIQHTGTAFARVLENQGILGLINCVVQNGNVQTAGGGIYNNGTLTLSGSTVTNNKAGLNGGGIFSSGYNGVYLGSTTVSNNTTGAGGEGGAGIYGIGSSISLVQSRVTGNKSSTNAGGVYSNDTAVFAYQSTISTNTAGFDGGGFYHAAGFQELNLTESTVENNKATGNGGGVYSVSVSGMYFDGSTISNNTARLNGGGIYSSSRCLGMRSTISTNTAQGNGGGVYSIPGDNHYLEVAFVTIGYNKAASGAGVYITHANTQTRASIVAKNQLPNGTFEDYRGNPHARDLDNPRTFRSVFGTINGTTNVFPGPDGDIVGLSNILPLANNGGPTKTHEIPANSSALNKFVPDDIDLPCPATDQRGRPRPVGAACDLGSYERQ